MTRQYMRFLHTAVSVITAILVLSCTATKKGSLIFSANGENFVRQGFTDKGGWKISFVKLTVNITDICAYNETDGLKAELKEEYLVDLAHGDENVLPIKVAELKNIPTGNYQSLKFRLKRLSTGKDKGATIIMQGKACKDNETIPFIIKLDEELVFDGKEGYVGDVLKGIVKENRTADVEMTFHFDHIFGDIETPADDHINTHSVGFDYFRQFSKNGKVTVSQAEMRDTKDYNLLVKAIWTLGHLGEGHCDVSEASTVL